MVKTRIASHFKIPDYQKGRAHERRILLRNVTTVAAFFIRIRPVIFL